MLPGLLGELGVQFWKSQTEMPFAASEASVQYQLNLRLEFKLEVPDRDYIRESLGQRRCVVLDWMQSLWAPSQAGAETLDFRDWGGQEESAREPLEGAATEVEGD